jgi:ribosomal protein L11 methyltransferase
MIGVVMGMDFSDRQKSRRVYVQLDNPHIQIKVYAEDLDYHYNCRYGPEDGNTYNRRGSTVCIVPMSGSFNNDVDNKKLPPKFRAGDPVSIRVGDYAQFFGQKSRSRWVFIMIPQKVEEDKAALSQSLVRNSVIDIDLLKDLDELSQMSSFSESNDASERDSDDVLDNNEASLSRAGSSKGSSAKRKHSPMPITTASILMLCTLLVSLTGAVDGFHLAFAPRAVFRCKFKQATNVLQPLLSTKGWQLWAQSADKSDGDDSIPRTSPADLRSVTFSNIEKDQEPQILCNFLMELGACSTSITDVDVGTDQESPLFDEFDTITMTRTAPTTQVWEHCHVTAHFPASISLEWIMEIVQDSFPDLPRYDKVTNVEDRDWVLHVQKSWKPIVLPPFVLRFPWHTDSVVEDAIRLHQESGKNFSEAMVQLELQGGIAFGTGEHPTTQLCLEFIRNAVRPGMLIMDYGAGSGVLGMAACKLDSTVKAVGVDVDVDAVQIGNANAEINQVDMKNYLSNLVQTSEDDESTSILLKAYSSRKYATTEVLPDELNGPIYDACVANILAAPLVSLAPIFAGLLKPGAPLGLSGIMKSQSAMILESAYKDYFDDLQVEKELSGWLLVTGIRKG